MSFPLSLSRFRVSVLPRCAALLVLTAGVPSSSPAGVSMVPLTSFSGDGWLAPGDILHLGTGSLERGIAYNKATDHLLLVSRNGNTVRILNAETGADTGELSNPGGFSGGTFALNMIGVGDDGAIFVSNLQGNIAANAYKVYRWESEAAPEPAIWFNNTVTNVPTGATQRVGDSFDVIGSGTDARLVTGFSSSPSGTTGYLVLTAAPGPTPPDPPVVSPLPFNTFTPSGPVAGDFRLGITFGTAGADHVWGKQTSGTARRTTWAAPSTAEYKGTLPLTNTGEAAMDVAVVGGVPLLAVLEVNSTGAGKPNVRVYDVTDPAAPAIQATASTATGTLTANTNGVGSIKWGKITPGDPNTTATLYAMATNQGIQAFTVTVTPEVTPPAIATPPADRTIYERGVATFTVTATGTPPLTYQWLHENQEIPGATSATLKFHPVTQASAGNYTCRVSGAAAPPVVSAPGVLTVAPSVNTTGLTELWLLEPGSRNYLTEGDTQRGLGYNQTKGRLYMTTRTPATGIHILNAADGSDAGTLNMTDVTGGFYAVNMAGVAADGVFYAANLTTSGADFRIYQWPDDLPETVPARVYDGNPIGSRIGDSFAVRGAGAATEFVAGARDTNQFVIFKIDDAGFFVAYPVTVTGAANGAFTLSVAFGQGNTVWGKTAGGGAVLASYDVDAVSGNPTGTGTVVASFPTAVVPGAGGAIAVDNTNGFLAHIHTGDSDNVRLYNLPIPFPDPAPATLELLDQEFYDTDNVNANSTGTVVFGGDKLFALNTNNGLAAYTVTRPPPAAAPPVITDVTQTGGNVVFKLRGTIGKTYLIEKSTQLTPAPAWTADGTVTQAAAEETVTRPIPAATPRLYFRAREQ